MKKASLQSELDKLDQHREILIKEINKTQKKLIKGNRNNMTTSISVFEREKPVITMKKINELISSIEEERVKTEILYKDRIRSLEQINMLLLDMKESFTKGE